MSNIPGIHFPECNERCEGASHYFPANPAVAGKLLDRYFLPPVQRPSPSQRTRIAEAYYGSVRASASVSIPPSQGIRVGWSLFWRSVWWTLRRRGSVTFEMCEKGPA